MEMPIQWQSTFSVGIQVIDEQHQHLIQIINALAAELDTKVGPVEVKDFFKEFVNYGEYHFQTEETYFNKYDYPERPAHLAAHAEYRKTMQSFLVREGDSRTIAAELLAFLEKWWVGHITGMDQTLRDLKRQ